MTTTLTREQSRRVDRLAMEKYGISGLVLMENAGRAITDQLCRSMAARNISQDADTDGPGRIVICCGRGNNAGDGFVIARHLDLRGYDARVLLWSEPSELAGDAATNFRIIEKIGLPIEIFGGRHDRQRLARELADAARVVDALLGTGAGGQPRPPLDAVIEELNASGIPSLAVDVPSGLDCDTGQPARHTIRAAETCTMVAAKPGFFAAGAERYTGRVHVLDIGTPPKLIQEVLAES